MRPSPEVIDHSENPRNAGTFPPATPGVITGVARGPNQGDVVRLHLRIEGTRVAEARSQTFGCAYTIAAGSRLTELVSGRHLTDLELTAQTLSDSLQLPPEKFHSAEIAVAALHAALNP